MFDYKFQIAALTVLVIVLINFYRSRKLPLMSTKIFRVFLIVSFLNLLFDVSTVYTITHMDIIAPWINRLAHQLFIGSLDLVAFLLFLYVNILANNQKRPPFIKLIAMSIPFVFAVFMVLFGSLEYHVGEDGIYSYGPMAMTVYLSVFSYAICIIVNLAVVRGRIEREKKALIISGLSVLIIVALIQNEHPTILMSSLGCMMLVLLVYLSYENPKEYVDKETGAMDRMAFHQMTEEMYASNKDFYVINYTLDDMRYIQDVFGHASVSAILTNLNRRICEYTCARVFHSRSNSLTVILRNKKQLNRLISDAEHSIIEWDGSNGVDYAPTFHMNVIHCPEFAKRVDDLYDLIDFLIQKYSTPKQILIIDEKIVEQFNRYAAIEDLVEKAVHNDGFDVFYQPIFSNQTQAFSSAEALVRLKDTSTLGFISPEIFIPIAEQRGFIKELGNIVFEKVCMFIRDQKLEELGVQYVEVNLSGIQGVDINLVDTLTAMMNKYQIDPKSINLEITETASVEAGDILISNMKRLREFGCHFSMDDFGTGYSNISQMAKVKFELIKLDKSLIWPCFENNNEEARIILDNCVNMICQLGVHIVAEGVETKEQVDYLTEKGITYLQGYYFSKPINSKAYVDFLAQNMK